jgi:flagellum-specific peptidoglycan hydrolase FlgJ
VSVDKKSFFLKAIRAAVEAGHVFPEFASCEAALESDWGLSQLALKANDLFGQKEGFSSSEFPELKIRTHEVLTAAQVARVKNWPYGPPVKRDDGRFDAIVEATWPIFPDWKTSFAERMELLRRATVYHDALKASDGESFVREVSKHWATDPMRAEKVMITYRANRPLIVSVLSDLGINQTKAAGA